MITKTLTGVDFFDKRYGGSYRSRCMLVNGKSGTGKSVLGLQFAFKGIEQGERCLILSARPAEDLALYGEALGLGMHRALDNGLLVLLEYSNYIPGRDNESELVLPPDGFLQFEEIVSTHSIQRIVLDTALPWVTSQSPDKLPEHVLSFVRAFDRLGATTLLLMPKPVSALSFKLRSTLEDVVPVSVSLLKESETDRYYWSVTKYLGEKKAEDRVEYRIVKKFGLVDAASPEAQSAPEPVVIPALRASSPAGKPAGTAVPAPARTGARFSDVMLDGGAGGAKVKSGPFSFADIMVPKSGKSPDGSPFAGFEKKKG